MVCNEDVIVAEALTKDYGDKRAVDDLSFTVRPGLVTGFLGPNGSGKSDDDAPRSRARRADLRSSDRQRQALSRAPGAAARGRSTARGAVGPHGAVGPRPPRRARPDARHPEVARRRADRPGRIARGCAQAGRPVLARHDRARRPLWPTPPPRSRLPRSSSFVATRRPFALEHRRRGPARAGPPIDARSARFPRGLR